MKRGKNEITRAVTVIAPGGIEHAGLSILASRWKEAIEEMGSPCELLLGAATRHPDELPAEQFTDMANAIADWTAIANHEGRLLVVGLPADLSEARAVLTALADVGERATLLWELPAAPILGLGDLLGTTPPSGVRIATLNSRFVPGLQAMFPDHAVTSLPLSLPRIALRGKRIPPVGDPFAIAIGRLTTRKGAARLATLWAEEVGPHLGLKLLMLGSGHGAPDSEENRVQVVAAASEWVACEEIGPLAERLERVRSATCAVFPAVDDHLPPALAEAMAVESPVVVTPIAGHLELVDDAVTGFALKDSSLVDLATTIEGNLIENPATARRVAATAANRVRAAFAPSVAGRAILSQLS